MMNCVNTHLIIKPAAQKSDGLVYLSGTATMLQKRQILLIFAKHHVLGVLLHVFVIRLAGISDGKHDLVASKMLLIPFIAVTILMLNLILSNHKKESGKLIEPISITIQNIAG